MLTVGRTVPVESFNKLSSLPIDSSRLIAYHTVSLFGTQTPPLSYVIQLKVYKVFFNHDNCIDITMWSSDTLKELKEIIVRRSDRNLKSKKFYLMKFDRHYSKWVRIDDSNPRATMSNLQLKRNDILNVEEVQKPKCIYHKSNTNRHHDSTSVANDNSLTLIPCKTSINKESSLSLPTNCSIKYNYDINQNTLFDAQFNNSKFIRLDSNGTKSVTKCMSGICGLTNLGNTCYLNSAIQCLSNVPELTQRILHLNDSINMPPIFGAFASLIKNMWSGKVDSIEPSSLLLNISKYWPHYVPHRQQDAQEFMNKFLHLIHTELKQKETLITKLFYGRIQSSVTCLRCQTTDVNNEPISFLPLPINNGQQKAILYVKTNGEQEMISSYTNSNPTTVGDLIDYFVRQHQLKSTTSELVEAVDLSNNVIKYIYAKSERFSDINTNEFALIEYPPKTPKQKYIKCTFVNLSDDRPFRPPVYFVCPKDRCSSVDLSEQVDQIRRHLCSVTDAPISECYMYMKDRFGEYRSNRETIISTISEVVIKMSNKWINIYKRSYNFNSMVNNCSLRSLLSGFFREEKLDGEYYCSTCSKLTQAKQKSTLCSPLPSVLVIQLKRFTFDPYSNVKIDAHITFPLHDLDLSDYVEKNSSCKISSRSSTKYDLVAVSNHIGDSLTSGHYVTYGKNHRDQYWYSFNDTIVTRLDNEENVVTKNAYILVYMRKDTM